MERANKAPSAASRTPRQIFAVGTDETPVAGDSPAAPCSSQGFEWSRCVDSHHAAIAASPRKKRIVTPMAASSGRSWLRRLVLRHEIFLRSRHVVVVRPPVHHRELLAPVPMAGRGLRGLPLECRRPPGIAAGVLAVT